MEDKIKVNHEVSSKEYMERAIIEGYKVLTENHNSLIFSKEENHVLNIQHTYAVACVGSLAALQILEHGLSYGYEVIYLDKI